MVKNIIKDPIFLAQKADPATEADKDVSKAIEVFGDYIMKETLADTSCQCQ